MLEDIPIDASDRAQVRPGVWPAYAGVPPAVRAADGALTSAQEALQRERRALEGEIRIAPSADMLARDDPPRPAQWNVEVRPEASLAWSPLRSEILLAEARVVEAEAAWLEAWREAALAAWSLPVEVDRVRADRLQAERIVADLEERSGTTLDTREAQLDLAEATDDLLEVVEELAKLGLDRGDETTRAPAARPEPEVPAQPDPVDTRAYRALALRSAADVARSERRWRDAIVPRLTFDVGYAGSDARIEGRVGMQHGRPSARLDAGLVGTPQERAWASLSAAFRLGSDVGTVYDALEAARLEEVERLAAFEEGWRASFTKAIRAFEARRDRWRLAEDRLDVTHEPRDLDRARRAWLRMLSAYGDVIDRAEGWPRWREANTNAAP